MSTTTERPVAEPTFEELAKRVDDAVGLITDIRQNAPGDEITLTLEGGDEITVTLGQR